MRNFIEEFRAIIKKIDAPEPPKPRYDEPKPETPVKRFNIHKRSLPPGLDKIVVFSVTKAEAEWWVEYKLKTKCYHNDKDDSKTLIYYDVLPVDATPKEVNIFSNPARFCTEEFPEIKSPRRIN